MRVAFVSVACAFCLLGSSAPGSAQLRLNDAEFLSGLLVVAGKTSNRHQTVTLDDKYVTRSDRRRRFVFRVPYRPPSCSVRVQAGRDVRDASIPNCAVATASGSLAQQIETRASGLTLRLVRAACASERECAVTCDDDEIALNALCPKKSPATLASQRNVSCGTGNGAAMVAICARR